MVFFGKIQSQRRPFFRIMPVLIGGQSKLAAVKRVAWMVRFNNSFRLINLLKG